MNAVATVSGILNATGCGSTVDTFRSQQLGDSIMMQWLWAAPLGTHTAEVREHAKDMVQEISLAGFSASTEINDFFCLANETEESGACPFRPVSCVGSHVIVSGAGYLAVKA